MAFQHVKPTKADYELLHHALGRPDSAFDDTSRNYYACDANGLEADHLESLGWWDFQGVINGGRGAIYCVNDTGRLALNRWLKELAAPEAHQEGPGSPEGSRLAL